VTALCRQQGVTMLPLDSEHSAIFQCLQGHSSKDVKRLLLTASGGPFLGKSLDQLANVTPAQAVKHPNWKMGAKISVDSASLMNKGLEIIEASWLFGISPEKIDVLVHPQSIIHSMVEFNDGAVLAQLGIPSMELPIQYALSWPRRWPGPDSYFLDWLNLPSLSFSQPDTVTFPCLELAKAAIR
ncbi:MAG TPA: 1-deoxy-D-xylulose-5-phosphate reductoisomerase, partial [Firmicutes bacterium]|nr:1-deoxy-D-xylulose-5-phosphate reductoisomerase [Bacillota bacterium]